MNCYMQVYCLCSFTPVPFQLFGVRFVTRWCPFSPLGSDVLRLRQSHATMHFLRLGVFGTFPRSTDAHRKLHESVKRNRSVKPDVYDLREAHAKLYTKPYACLTPITLSTTSEGAAFSSVAGRVEKIRGVVNRSPIHDLKTSGTQTLNKQWASMEMNDKAL